MAGKSKKARKKKEPKARHPFADHAPLEHQMQYSDDPFEEVMAKLRNAVITVNGRPQYVDVAVAYAMRRQSDARVFERFNEQQLYALYQIAGSYRLITISTGMRTFDPERISGPGDAAASVEFNHDLTERWRPWVNLCKDREVDWRVTRDFIGHGLSARFLDEFYKRRKGWALDEVERAVALWSEVRINRRKAA